MTPWADPPEIKAKQNPVRFISFKKFLFLLISLLAAMGLHWFAGFSRATGHKLLTVVASSYCRAQALECVDPVVVAPRL